jgi:hypothetical protein
MKNSTKEPKLIQSIPHTQKKNYSTEESLKKITKEWTNLYTFGKEDAELEELHGKMRPTLEKVLRMLNN